MAQQNTDQRNKRKCILLLGGSFSPIHNGHIAILVKIKDYLESNHNYHVISAFLVLSSDRYVAGKLNVHGMGYVQRKQICDIAVSNYKWIHSSHIATASADYYGEIITRSREYKKFFNKRNSNELDDTKQELRSLVRIVCMGGDKLYDNVQMMQWLAKCTDRNGKYCCIGRQGQGYTHYLLEKYNEYIKDGSIKKDTFYFIGENGTSKDMSSTIIREYLLTILLHPPNQINEEKKDENNEQTNIISTADIDGIRKKMEESLDDAVIKYMLDNIQSLFFTDDEITQCLLKRGKVVAKKANK